MFRYLRIAIFALVAVSLLPLAGQAQTLPGTGSSAPAETSADSQLPDPLTPQAVEAMVARMSDDEVRDMLLERLDAVAQAEAADPAAPVTFMSQATNLWLAFSGSVMDAVSKLPAAIVAEGKAIANFVKTFSFGGVMLMFLWMAIILGVAYGAERLLSAYKDGYKRLARLRKDRRQMAELARMIGLSVAALASSRGRREGRWVVLSSKLKEGDVYRGLKKATSSPFARLGLPH